MRERSYTSFMAFSAHKSALSQEQGEPLTRTLTHEVPNLRNAEVAREYKRQRTIIHASTQTDREMAFWEPLQSQDGWV